MNRIPTPIDRISGAVSAAWDWWTQFFMQYLYIPMDSFWFWGALGTAFTLMFIATIRVCKDDKSMVVLSYRAVSFVVRLTAFVYLIAVIGTWLITAYRNDELGFLFSLVKLDILMMFCCVFVAYIVALFAIRWWFEPWLSELASRSGGAKQGGDSAYSDVRNIKKLKFKSFNPEDYFLKSAKKNAMFFGLDEKQKPVYIPLSDFEKTHTQIMGEMGTGKGVQAQVILAQQLLRREAVYVFDPKYDDWLPSVMKHYCEKAGLPFHFINLRESTPQINAFQTYNEDRILDQFIAAFQLAESPGDSEYYRIVSRDIAADLAMAVVRERLSLAEAYNRCAEFLTPEQLKKGDGFLTDLKTLARLQAFQTLEGLDLYSVMQSGGCVYIVGDEVPRIKKAQKMLLQSVMDEVKHSANTSRKFVSIFLDEAKHMISKNLFAGLGQTRSRRCNILFAHQSPADWADGGDIDKETATELVRDNATLKWFYRTSNQEVAQWISEQTGTKVAQVSTKTVDRNELAGETLNMSRRSQEAQVPLYDANFIRFALPDSTAIMVGTGFSRIAYSAKLMVNPCHFEVTPAPPLAVVSPTQEIQAVINSSPAQEVEQNKVIRNLEDLI